MLNQTNVVPQTFVSTQATIPVQAPVQAQVQSVVPTIAYQPVPGQIYQTPSQVVSKTSVVPEYGTTPVAQVSQVPVVSSTVPVQTPSTYVSTQPQTRYKIWNMLVPAFQPEPEPVPVTQTVTIPEPIPEPVQTYEIPAEPVYEIPSEPVYEEPTYTIPETQYVETQYQTTSPNVNVIRRGSGITLNEQQNIINCAVNVYQQKLEPMSNKTAQAVKRSLGGDWLVIVYPHGKPIDFNMTCVQGNDYLYFTVDSWAFQVCRLR